MRKVTLEKHVEAYLVREVNKLGGVCWKWQDMRRRHLPDRVVCLPKLGVVFIEVKRPGGKATPGQLQCHEVLRKAGARVYVLDSREAVDAFIEKAVLLS